MRIKSLTLSGFTSYKKGVTIDFSDLSVFVITGPNGAGKSSIVEAILFALYGRSPRSEKGISHLISQDASKMEVDLEFYVDREFYKVFRRYKRGSNGKVSTSAIELRRWKDGKWSLVSSGSKEVTKAIEGMLGMDYHTFIRAVIIPQNMFDRFLKPESARERRDILITLLGLTIYEKIRDYAREEKNKIEKDMARDQGRWEQVKEVTEDLVGSLEKEMKEKARELKVEEKRLEEITKEYEHLRYLYEKKREYEKIKQKFLLLEREKERYENIRKTIENAKMVKGFSERYRYLKRMEEDCKKKENLLKEDRERLKVIKERVKGLEDKREGFLKKYGRSSVDEVLKSLEDEKDRFLGVLEKIEDIKDVYKEFLRLAADIKERASVLLEKGKAYKKKYEAYKLLLSKFEEVKRDELRYYARKISKNLSQGDRCPVCGGIYTGEKIGDEELPVLELDTLREDISKKKIELTEIKGSISSIREILKEKEAQKEKKKEILGKFKEYVYERLKIDITGYKLEEVEGLLNRKIEEVKNALDGARILESHYLEIREKKGFLEERVKEREEDYVSTKEVFDKERREFEKALMERGYKSFEEIRVFLRSDEEIEKMENKYKGYTEDLFATQKQLIDLSWIEKEGDIEKRLKDAQEKLRVSQVKIRELTSTRATLEEKLKKAKTDLEDKKALEERIKQAERRLTLYNTILQDLQSDRLPEYILATVMETLFERASKNLEDLSYGRYTLELDEKDNIVVIDAWNGGERRSVDTLSGGEVFATSLALAISLRELVQGKGILDTFFIDEGFGTLDKETRERVIDILGALSETGKLVGIITHVEELAMNFPVGFKVHKSPDGSEVEVINPIS